MSEKIHFVKLAILTLVLAACKDTSQNNGSDPEIEPQELLYTPPDETIANPDSRLQKYPITDDSYYAQANYSNIDVERLKNWREGEEKITVIYRYFLMNDFIESEITREYLANIQLDFDRIREAGLKCLVRFSYTNRQSAEEPQQPVKSLILEHIAQLAPILEENQDVIVAHQAGFIGTWGEWYYTNSEEFGTDGNINEEQWQNRKEVVEAMLDATPSDISVQLRYPSAKINMYGDEKLVDETAYTTASNARLGFYNDAFLNVWGDMGTYRGSGQDRDPTTSDDYLYLANETRYLPMTGETNGLNPPRTDGENAVKEMDLTNWSIINRDYHRDVIDGWIASGHFEEMLRYLGYRFQIDRSAFVPTANHLEVTLEMEIVGYARAFRERDVCLVFENRATKAVKRFPVETDVRKWEGEFDITTSIERSKLENGEYEVSIAIVDKHLDGRSEYAIQLANEGTWDEVSGRNVLGTVQL